MEWLNVDESVFYSLTWLFGFLASVFATLGGPHAQSLRKCFFISGISGFFAFATVAIFVGRISQPIIGHWYYLGLAALIGLSGNQQESLRKALTDFVVGRRFNDKQ